MKGYGLLKGYVGCIQISTLYCKDKSAGTGEGGIAWIVLKRCPRVAELLNEMN